MASRATKQTAAAVNGDAKVEISSASVRDFVDAVASDEPTPGGGAVAGTVAALAAALAGMAGRYTVQRDAASVPLRELVERVDALRARAMALADEDAVAYGRYAEASRLPKQPDPERRRKAVRAALDAAADVPFELGQVAAEVATAGEHLVAAGNPNLRSDACTAALLASAVATSAAILVGENLRAQPDDPRRTEASRCAAEAAAAARKALTPFDYLQDRITS
jgi:formiminotetrahydrofolate cyclodeaminase